MATRGFPFRRGHRGMWESVCAIGPVGPGNRNFHRVKDSILIPNPSLIIFDHLAWLDFIQSGADYEHHKFSTFFPK